MNVLKLVTLLAVFFSCSDNPLRKYPEIQVPEYNIRNATLTTSFNKNKMYYKLELIAPRDTLSSKTSDTASNILVDIPGSDTRAKIIHANRLYNALISDGYEKENIGSSTEFIESIRDSAKANKLHAKLLKDGYTTLNIGTADEFVRAFSFTHYESFRIKLQSSKSVEVSFQDKNGFNVFSFKIPIANLRKNMEGKMVHSLFINANTEMDRELYGQFRTFDITFL